MKVAFKEWVIVVDALARGDQIIILRKGGIREGKGGFKIDHERFLLFPTRYHQQREAVIPAAQARFDQLGEAFPPPDRLRIEYLADVITWQRLDSLEAVRRLQGRHIWRDEVVAQRFEWGRRQDIHALAVRVSRLPEAVELPMRPEYGGCQSWIELAEDVPVEGANPVLDEATLEAEVHAFNEALTAPSVST